MRASGRRLMRLLLPWYGGVSANAGCACCLLLKMTLAEEGDDGAERLDMVSSQVFRSSLD